jgi:hypothetical protein
MQVFVDGAGTVTASGIGGASRTVNELVVGGGGDASTLALSAGAGITALNGVSIEAGGVVRGDGTLVGQFNGPNLGEVRAGSGERLNLTTSSFDNTGRVEAIGTSLALAEIEFDGEVTNNAGSGSIVARNAILRFDGGLNNSGAFALSFGITDVVGDVINRTSGTIAVAGNSGVTFFDDVTNGGTLNVAGGSTAVFFGALSGNGNVGSGDVQALGDLLPGASPGLMHFGGDLTMGPLTNLTIEIAGTAGSQFDQLVIAGDATLAGTLNISLFDGFTLSLGQSFEIVDIGGARSGAFFGLAEGATLGNFGGTDLFITYAGGDGNDVVLFVPGLPGDYNEDHVVNAADYTVWRNNLGSSTALPNDDSAGVAADDYDRWKTNFGQTLGNGAASAVPEPASLALLLVATTMVYVRHRRASTSVADYGVR